MIKQRELLVFHADDDVMLHVFRRGTGG
jgi:hypothetical protein